MRKVVINTCYGGFDLSNAAKVKLFQLKHPGEQWFFYTEEMCTGRKGYPCLIRMVKLKDECSISFNMFISLFVSNFDYGDVVYINQGVHLTDEQLMEYNLTTEDIKRYHESSNFWDEEELDNNMEYLSFYDIDRHDEDLVKVVKEMGESSFGSYSDLTVVEIDDNDRYIIIERDGLEYLELESECHNKNWQ